MNVSELMNAIPPSQIDAACCVGATAKLNLFVDA